MAEKIGGGSEPTPCADNTKPHCRHQPAGFMTELFENWGRVQEINGRSGGIRTHDPLTPSQVRYRAALRSDLPKRLVSFIVSSPQMQAQNAGAGIKMTRRRGKLAKIRRKRPGLPLSLKNAVLSSGTALEVHRQPQRDCLPVVACSRSRCCRHSPKIIRKA